jgi:hypothetical protein
MLVEVVQNMVREGETPMNYYATEMLAQSRNAELLREAGEARLAKLAREHHRATHKPRFEIKLAMKHIAAAASALVR